MKTWRLENDGFIAQYMIAGPSDVPYQSETSTNDQLKLEALLRNEIVTKKPLSLPQSPILLGNVSENGKPWQVWAPCSASFIDVSEFYSTLRRIRLDAATVLVASTAMQVRAVVWSFMAVGVYLNGALLGEIARPVYKPIQSLTVTLDLKEGENTLFFLCDNLGVRDTRNMLGVQILDRTDELSVALPDHGVQDEVFARRAFLSDLDISGDELLLPARDFSAEYCYPLQSPDFAVMRHTPAWEMLPAERLTVPKEHSLVTVRVPGNGCTLSRSLEFSSHEQPVYLRQDGTLSDTPDETLVPETFAHRLHTMMEQIGAVESLNRGPFGFAISNILARRHIKRPLAKDRELLFGALDLIEERVDCADFLLCGLFRYLHLYGCEGDSELSARIKDVLLHFRYWMDMDGSDAMCFWSENHSLMFYYSAMEAGWAYPDEIFVRAGMTGSELAASAGKKVKEWLSDTLEEGFEEFQSTVYLNVTMAVLLNVADYAGGRMSAQAKELLDRMLTDLFCHVFQKTVIAPMGRVYRGVIYPFSQGTQALVSLVDPTAPYAYGEGWLAFLSGSSYEFPVEKLRALMDANGCWNYTSGNAKISLEKHQHFCLTSVRSPRVDAGFTRWENIRNRSDADTHSHLFTKSLNECFHGTSCFAPGVYGYQQHLWYAALSPEAVLFVNHPATTAEASDMRPGYWFGNGVMPALAQLHSALGVVYDIPENFPIRFTHVYFPAERFDEVRLPEQAGEWLVARKGEGFVGLWCSGKLSPWNDTIFHCELRCADPCVAYLCVCADTGTYKDLEVFSRYLTSLAPTFDASEKVLRTADSHSIRYIAQTDDTQVIL